MHRALLLFLVLILSATGQGLAQLSPDARISVITCGPGDELYARFGHSAFRVTDRANRLDLVYNYGTFDFNAPGFYTAFARGQLDYFLSRSAYRDFLYTYEYEGRWVQEQVLDLAPAERNALFRYLEFNHQPDQRYYRYDFLQENCATKIPDVLKAVLGESLHLDPDYLEQDATYRQLIQSKLDWNSWSSFGIDLALGSVIDRPAGPRGHWFLPDYVKAQLDEASLDQTPLVRETRELLPAPAIPETINLWGPATFIGILVLIGFLQTFRDLKNRRRSPWLDTVLLGFTGAAGILIFFLWFLTDHTATAMNLNILWAMPLNLFWFLPDRFFPAGIRGRRYFLLGLLGCLFLGPLLWLFQVQAFHVLTLPIWALLALRYSFLYRYFCKHL